MTTVAQRGALDQGKKRQIRKRLLSDTQLPPLPGLIRRGATDLLRQSDTYRVTRQRW